MAGTRRGLAEEWNKLPERYRNRLKRLAQGIIENQNQSRLIHKKDQ
jgi:hypothetical protein